MTGIYKITNHKGSIYIGQAVNIKRRETDYARAGCKSQKKIYSSIKKYGWENHTFEILLLCERNELNKYERLLGLQYDVLSRKNLNLNLPADGELPKLVSEETRLKQSIGAKGNQKRLGVVLSEETKLKISNTLKGRKLSEEHKLNMSIGLTGRKVSELTISKLKERRSKKVINITILEIYNSLKEVSDITSLKINLTTCI
jgi:group I intron endonuclease